MSSLRVIFRSGAFVTLSAAILAAYEVNRAFVPKEHREQLADEYRNRLSNMLLDVFGAKVLVTGERTHKTGALVVANHQSAFCRSRRPTQRRGSGACDAQTTTSGANRRRVPGGHMGEPLPSHLEPRSAASMARARVAELVMDARKRLDEM